MSTAPWHVRVSRVEILTGMTAEGEGAFVGMLDARFHSTLEDMAAVMRAPTFPVHDEPDDRKA